MKKYTAIALIFILASMSNNVFAGEEYEKKTITKMEDRAPIFYDFDLGIEIEGTTATAEWNSFVGEGFDWFKLVYSTTNSQPVYPEDKTVFIGKKDQLTAKFKLTQGASTHYVRICAVVLNDDYSKDRYCSDVKSIDMTIDENPNTTDYEKKEIIKKSYEEKKTIKKVYLSEKITNRVDTFLENFIKKLEDKDFSDAKMITTIDTILERLTKYKENAKYKALISYMQEALNEYRADYDSGLDDLESIFSGF